MVPVLTTTLLRVPLLLLMLTASATVAQISFPGAAGRKSVLPRAEPCACASNGTCGDKFRSSFCGEDIANYPVDEINRIFEQTEALRASAETFDRFFRAGTPLNGNAGSEGANPRHIEDNDLETACASRTELIPRFARAKNIKGKWKYLLQASDGNVQNYQITACLSAGGHCINDLDSPTGEGLTICRQIFKHEKLLALDESGDVVVDTFALPSACVCHFRESPLAAPQIDLSTRLGGAANADTGAKDKAEGRGADDGEEEADDPRCEEEEDSLDQIISSARSRSAFSSFRFPGATSGENEDDDRSKRRTESGGGDDSSGGGRGSAVGPRSSDIDPDRVYFGRRPAAVSSRRGAPSLRGQQGSQALWEGKRRRRRKRRQVNFETSRPLQPAGSSVHSIGVRSNELPSTSSSETQGPSPDKLCDLDDEICLTDHPDYPLTQIRQGLTRHGTLDDKKAFSSLFGPSCGNSSVNVALRQSFDLKESPLCKAYQKYIFPQKALTVRGEYRFIINTGDYKQGVTVETCTRKAKGRSCKYAGREGRYPHATVCKQMYSLQNMLAIDDEATVYVETFRIPSACVCELVNKDPFL